MARTQQISMGTSCFCLLAAIMTGSAETTVANYTLLLPGVNNATFFNSSELFNTSNAFMSNSSGGSALFNHANYTLLLPGVNNATFFNSSEVFNTSNNAFMSNSSGGSALFNHTGAFNSSLEGGPYTQEYNWTCSDNRQDYTVSLDLQLRFGASDIAACGTGEQSMLANTISDTLNLVFPSRVPSWKGDTFFGAFGIDTNQQVNKRRLRGEASRTLLFETNGIQCPEREIDCEGDVCLWGCLAVATSDCGISSLVNWVNVLEDVISSLKRLGYNCLGDILELEVNLLIYDHPDDPDLSATWPV